MNRSPVLQKFLDDFSQSTFGRSNSEAVKTRTCVICEQPADTFRDTLSLKEFGISGLCQKCQDKTFGKPIELDEWDE